MAVNKVVYGNTDLIDLTNDTVTAQTLASGYTAHDNKGNSIMGTGNLITGTIYTVSGVVTDTTNYNIVITAQPTQSSGFKLKPTGGTIYGALLPIWIDYTVTGSDGVDYTSYYHIALMSVDERPGNWESRYSSNRWAESYGKINFYFTLATNNMRADPVPEELDLTINYSIKYIILT